MVNAANLTVEKAKELTFCQEELDELKQARSAPIVFDEDCLEITPEQTIKFRCVNSVKCVAN